MGNFNRGGGSRFGGRDSDRDSGRGGFRGGRDSGRGGFGGGRSSFGRGEDREMFQATCTECGKSCEVPFKPTGSKPVLCRDCFRSARGSEDRGGRDFGSRDFGARGGRDRDGGDRPMFSAVCEKCGNQCEVPFRPTGDKPVYCKDCFGSSKGGNGGVGGKSAEHIDQQFAQLNEKLDRILKRLTPAYMRETPTEGDTTESTPVESAETTAGETFTLPKPKKASKKKTSKKTA